MLLPPINVGTIQRITTFQLDPNGNSRSWGESRPAWLVETTGGDLVLKAELSTRPGAVGAKSAQWAGKVMGKVSPQAKPQLLTGPEKTMLLTLPGGKFRAPLHEQYFKDVLGANVFFVYKMQFVAGLKEVGDMLANGKNDKLIQKLKNQDTMVKLGHVVAADMFNGNEDRFNKEGSVVNVGNIFFQKDAVTKAYTPVGVDFFEAQGGFTSAFKSDFSGDLDAWAGMTLKDDPSMNRLARNLIASLNLTVNGAIKLNNWGDLTNLTNGIKGGRDHIKTELTRRYNTANRGFVMGNARGRAPKEALPSGLVEKMKKLGWIM